MTDDKKKEHEHGTPLAVQWLRLRTSIAGGTGSIPGRGTKIPHAVQCGKKKKNKQHKLDKAVDGEWVLSTAQPMVHLPFIFLKFDHFLI